MAKLRASLKSVRTAGCAKLKCQTRAHILQRHHLRHQAMWLGIWAGRRRTEQKYKELVVRYHTFVPEDIVRICDSHHAEIHAIYDLIIAEDIQDTGRNLSEYSWTQAERLMAKLEAACRRWLKIETSGISSNAYSRTKQSLRTKLKIQAAYRRLGI